MDKMLESQALIVERPLTVADRRAKKMLAPSFVTAQQCLAVIVHHARAGNP
jgi:hypothetical protein